jgi:TPR repeat protein
MYANGRGVSLDYIEAYKWVGLAAAQNWRIAVDARRSLAGIMTKRQLSAAEARISEWHQQHIRTDQGSIKRRIIFESP